MEKSGIHIFVNVSREILFVAIPWNKERECNFRLSLSTRFLWRPQRFEPENKKSVTMRPRNAYRKYTDAKVHIKMYLGSHISIWRHIMQPPMTASTGWSHHDDERNDLGTKQSNRDERCLSYSPMPRQVSREIRSKEDAAANDAGQTLVRATRFEQCWQGTIHRLTGNNSHKKERRSRYYFLQCNMLQCRWIFVLIMM